MVAEGVRVFEGTGVMVGVRVIVGVKVPVGVRLAVKVGRGVSSGLPVAVAGSSRTGPSVDVSVGATKGAWVAVAGWKMVAVALASGRTGTSRTGKLQADKPRNKNTSKGSLRIID
jgi:hypothetical protein